jgi:ABC-type polysaccharide/polyol phosphate export permease
LVKKIQFKYVVLPFIKVLSSLTVHFAFIAVLFIVLLLKGIKPNINWLGLIYYLFCGVVFLLGVGWLVSSIAVLFPDMPHMVNVFLQFGFWLTPICWSPEMLPKNAFLSQAINWLTLLNPAAYIIEGYRCSLLYNLPFWINPGEMLLFWIITLILCFTGIFTFSHLKLHFSDIL